MSNPQAIMECPVNEQPWEGDCITVVCDVGMSYLAHAGDIQLNQVLCRL